MFKHALLKLALALAIFVLQTGWGAARPSILIDARTGMVLSHKQAFDRWYPASLTKMMTAYVVYQAIKSGEITLKSPVRVSKYALSKPPSRLGLPAGTVLNMETALKVILVKSANDIAVSIAESVAGSEAAFVRRMNRTAARLGMNGTKYVNPHGLYSPQQYTTARDLGLLSMALYRDFPQYAYILKIPALRLGKKKLKSYNSLLGRYRGADGIKTGYVCASGYNIAASAVRSGRRLIAIVLGAENAHERGITVAKLLNSGFNRTTGRKAISIKRLAPYGKARFVARNIKSEICKRKKSAKKESRKQRRARWKKEAIRRKTQNALYFSPPAPFNPVRIFLGNASGPSPVGIKVVEGGTPPTYVPIPTRRPKFQLARIDDGSAMPESGQGIAKISAIRGSIPLPTFRSSVIGQ